MARTSPYYPTLQAAKILSILLLVALVVIAGLVIAEVLKLFPPKPDGWYVTYNVIAFLLMFVWLGALAFGAFTRNIRAITFSIIIQILVIAACIIWAIVLIIGIADYDYGGGDGTILNRQHQYVENWNYDWNKQSKTWLIVGLFIYAFVQAIILAVSYRARNELRLAVPPADAY